MALAASGGCDSVLLFHAYEHSRRQQSKRTEQQPAEHSSSMVLSPVDDQSGPFPWQSPVTIENRNDPTTTPTTTTNLLASIVEAIWIVNRS